MTIYAIIGYDDNLKCECIVSCYMVGLGLTPAVSAKKESVEKLFSLMAESPNLTPLTIKRGTMRLVAFDERVQIQN